MILRLCILLVLAGCIKRPAKNSVFYVNIGSEPSKLNPIGATEGAVSAVTNYIFESLLSKNIETYEWESSLAESWEILNDGMEFKFTLKPDLYWSDGHPLTSEDIKFSFDIMFEDKFNTAAVRPYYEGIKEIIIEDKRTVRFIAKDKYYKNFDTAAGMSIYPKHFYSQDKKKSYFNKNVIGSGPYKLELYNRGNRILLTKNELWWGYQDPNNKEWNFPKIVLRFVKDNTVALEMFKKGSFDFLSLQPNIFLKHAKGGGWGKDYFKVKSSYKAPSGYTFIGWNMNDKILKDLQVRKALNHLVNRELMIEKFEYNMKIKAHGPVHPKSPYFNKDIPKYDFNPKQALKMLKQSGWRDSDGDNILDKNINGRNEKLSITILEPYKPYEKYLTVFKEDARKAGVEINIKPIEWSSFVKLLEERNFQAVRLAWSATVDWDPVQIWHSKSIKGGSNFVSFSDSKVDAAIDEARFVHDRAQRIKILNQAQKRIVEQAPYAWLITSEVVLYSYQKRIQREKDIYNYGIGSSFWKFASEMRVQE